MHDLKRGVKECKECRRGELSDRQGHEWESGNRMHDDKCCQWLCQPLTQLQVCFEMEEREREILE